MCQGDQVDKFICWIYTDRKKPSARAGNADFQVLRTPPIYYFKIKKKKKVLEKIRPLFIDVNRKFELDLWQLSFLPCRKRGGRKRVGVEFVQRSLSWIPPSDNCCSRPNRMLKKTSQRWCDCKWLFGAQATDSAKCLLGIAEYQSAHYTSLRISVHGPIYKSRYFIQWATQSFITICGESAGVKLAAGGCPYVSCMQ